jgi:hypothetical protein
MRSILAALHDKRTLLLLTLAGLVAVGLAGRAGANWWADRRFEIAASEVIELLDLPPTADFHAKTDAVRIFVNDHSQHKIDAEFYADWNDPYLLAEKVLAHARGSRPEAAHMECSTRSALMSAAYKQMGYATRRIDIYDADKLLSHTFLEVMNPETRQWETQDPDYDLTWRKASSSERVSVAEAAGQLDDIVPCGRAECGWSIASREGIKVQGLRRYFDFIVVRSRVPDRRYTVHTDRADPSKIYDYRSRKGTFCEVMAKNCRDGLFAIGTEPRP